MHRDFERDDPRRRYRRDDDPRDDPRERYGNEEDQWSREYRRAYAEGDLPRRLHDDSPYNRPGYEPEAGRPGGRENVDLDRDRRHPYDARRAGDPYGYDWERPGGQRGGPSGNDRRDDRWQGGFYGQGRRFGGQPFEREGRGGRAEPYNQSSYNPSSPYDEGDISAWYGGDTGMGDPGTSQYRSPSSGQYGQSSGSRYGGNPSRSPSGSRFRDEFDDQTRQQYGAGGQSGSRGQQAYGQFSGRGPRGYQRADERILEDVCELLTRHSEIDASEMEVEVRSATVILRGQADSGRMRRLAEELVEDLPGVRDVQNELRVTGRSGHHPSNRHTVVESSAFADERGGQRESGAPAYGAGVAGTSGVSRRTGPGEPGASAGADPSQHGNRWQIRETMDVVGADGAPIGTVKQVHGANFHVNRPMGRDFFVPFSAVRTVDGERVMLNVRASEVDEQQWPAPGLAGSNSEGPAAR